MNLSCFPFLDICVRDAFILTPDQGFSAEYEWKQVFTSGFESYRGQQYQFTEANRSLSFPGDYTFRVSKLFNGCYAESSVFTIHVHADPDTPQIDLEGKNCGEDPVTIKVINPDSDLTYVWSNGVIGHSMITGIAGSYSVTASSELGCESKSSPVIVRSYEPYLLMTPGCEEMCSAWL